METKNQKIFSNARKACRDIIHITDGQIVKILEKLAQVTLEHSDLLIEENAKDLTRMNEEDPKYDRLKLTIERIKDIASDMKNVAGLSSPLEEVLEERRIKNGLHLKKIRVPLGVVGIIYEARPNVTFDVFSLCLKSGNVCLLKGGSDAEFSNKAIINIIQQVLQEFELNKNIVQLLPVDRQSTLEMLNATNYIDIIIPRGSQALIDFVRKNSTVPVIETGAGIVHTYFDEKGDLNKGAAIITNAKLRRVSVCNALDCLVIHRSRISDLPYLCRHLVKQEVEIYADETAYPILKDHYPEGKIFKASSQHFGTEFLSKKMSVKSVNSIDEALDHIAEYSSKHSEAIISEDLNAINRFFKEIDAAVVYSNTSTAFTDGAQFEMGAEIGISTQKLHARGPMALKELTSYKWIVVGSGQIREK
jgi:glutamate-5-semialdehyde dehydrogenase